MGNIVQAFEDRFKVIYYVNEFQKAIRNKWTRSNNQSNNKGKFTWPEERSKLTD